MKRGTRKMRKGLALLMVLSMTAMGLSAPAFGASKITKEETVYVVTDAGGDPDDVIVSDHLKNSTESKTLRDKSDLKKIENVKGDETFETGEDMALTWKADGKDIFYEGETAKELPVTMDITYKLDEEIVSGEELQGKSGDLEIRIDFENKAKVTVEGKEKTVPFMALCGLLTTDECFTDVKVSQGKVIDDGEKLIIVGMALPGLREDLNLEGKEITDKLDFDISDSITIEAKVNKFDVQNMMTIVSNSLFDEMDTDEIGSLDYDEQINELDKGASALEEGAGQLASGLDTLNGHMPELEQGAQQLKSGADQVSTGTDSALSGAKQLNSGAVKLRGTMKSKMKQIADASGQMQNGTETILSGMKDIKRGLDQGEGTAANPGAIKALDQVANGLNDAVTQSENAGKDLGDAAQKMSDGSEQLAQGGSQLSDGADRAAAGARQLRAGAENAQTYISAVSADGQLKPEIIQELAARGVSTDTIQALGGAVAAANSLEEGMSAGADGLDNAAQGLKTGSEGMTGASDLLSDTSDQLEDASEKMTDSSKRLKTAADAVSSVEKGLQTISANLGSYDKKLADQGKAQTTMIGGMTVINSGLKQLNSQAASSVSKDGVLTKALNKLVGGTDDLVSGEKQLSSGAKQLADGLGQMQTSAGELADGVAQLEDGSDQLAEGMSKLYKEGIKKIVDLYNNELKGSIEDMDDLVKAGKAYNIFTQLPEDMEGSVKFIYKTTIYE